MSEHVYVHKVITVLTRVGAQHKNGVARAYVAKLLADMVEALGVDKVMESTERDTADSLLRSGALLLSDGRVDTRDETKRMFAVLVRHPDFQARLEGAVENKKTIEDLKKLLATLKANQK